MAERKVKVAFVSNISMNFKKWLINENDKMSNINLASYYQKNHNNTEWLGILSKFPPSLQQEIIDERPNGSPEDIDELKSWKLLSNTPVEVNTKKLLSNIENLNTIRRTPSKVIDIINQKWNLNIKPGTVYDANPDRYLKYAQLPAATAKPSIMINGEIYWGAGRYIAALLRGDPTIKVWSISSN